MLSRRGFFKLIPGIIAMAAGLELVAAQKSADNWESPSGWVFESKSMNIEMLPRNYANASIPVGSLWFTDSTIYVMTSEGWVQLE